MIDLSAVTLAVLAGGAGRRMGQPKAWLRIDDEPILNRLLRRLAWPGPTLLISSPGREHPPGCELFFSEVVDSIADEGPLRGIATALAAAPTSIVVVVPVDMPNLTIEPLQQLAAFVQSDHQCTGAFFEVDGFARPLPVALRASLQTSIEKDLASGERALWRCFQTKHLQAISVGDSELWINLNQPSDLSNDALLPPVPAHAKKVIE